MVKLVWMLVEWLALNGELLDNMGLGPRRASESEGELIYEPEKLKAGRSLHAGAHLASFITTPAGTYDSGILRAVLPQR